CKFPVSFFTGKYFKPANSTLAAESLLHRRVEDALRSLPDVAACAVALNEWNDGMIGHLKLPAAILNGLAVLWQLKPVIGILHNVLSGVPFLCDPKMRLTPWIFTWQCGNESRSFLRIDLLCKPAGSRRSSRHIFDLDGARVRVLIIH